MALRVDIRLPVLADARALGPLHNHVWCVAYSGLMPDEYLRGRDDAAAVRRWEETISGLDAEGKDARGRATLGATVAGEIVGFLTVGPGRDEGTGDQLDHGAQRPPGRPRGEGGAGPH